MRLRWVGPWTALFLCAIPGSGQDKVLTLDEALAVARQRGVAAVLARGRLEEERALQARALRRFQQNPELEVTGGYRRNGKNLVDFEAAWTQPLDSGWRPARLAGAQAAVERAEAELAEAERILLRDVWTHFVRASLARDRHELLAKNRQVAEELLAAAQRRYDAGEATALELNRARTAAAAARAEQGAADAEATAALAELKALLGLSPGETIALASPLAPRPALDLDAMLAGLARRPDLRALEAELRAAQAEALFARSLRRPEVGVRGGLARDEGDKIVAAGLVLSLPIHNRGREALAAAEARAFASRQAVESARRAAEIEVRGKYDALAKQLAAAQELERTALPALADNEALAWKSFEAGEIDLGELLLIRREILEARLAYLDRLLDATLTRFELESAAGALP